MTEAITAMFERYLVISFAELLQFMNELPYFTWVYKLDDAKILSCGVTSCSCSRFENL